MHQGAYWNAQSVPDETEISGLSIHWGEGYVTKIPRSVLVFGAEEQEPVQRLFVPKTLQLVTCTVHHRYFLQTENEKLPEGEVLETLGTYVGASASDVVVRRLEYADNVYTGGELRADEEIETATVITLDYIRTLNALTPVTPAPSASEPTPEPLPGRSTAGTGAVQCAAFHFGRRTARERFFQFGAVGCAIGASVPNAASGACYRIGGRIGSRDRGHAGSDRLSGLQRLLRRRCLRGCGCFARERKGSLGKTQKIQRKKQMTQRTKKIRSTDRKYT